MPQTGNCFALRGSWEYWQSYRLLFTPFPATRFAMHRIYANRINSHGMSRVFCDLRSQKTPRGILPVNSNSQNSFQIACGNGILACMSRDFGIFMPKHLVCQQVDFSNNLASKFLISALSSVAVATATPPSSALK